MAAPNTVVISAATLWLVEAYLPAELGTHVLKGVAKPLEVSQVL